MNKMHGYYLNTKDGLEFASENLEDAIRLSKLFGNCKIRHFIAGVEVKKLNGEG